METPSPLWLKPRGTHAMFYQLADFLISKFIFYCSILSPSFTICLFEAILMDPFQDSHRFWSGRNVCKKCFTARRTLFCWHPHQCQKEKRRFLLFSASQKYKHSSCTDTTLKSTFEGNIVVLSEKTVPVKLIPQRFTVGKTSPRIFHPSIGFWNTVMIIKDLTH